jgi:hypothetical protein
MVYFKGNLHVHFQSNLKRLHSYMLMENILAKKAL